MDNKSLVRLFVEYFCNADLGGIESVLSIQFHLKGPLFEFDSKQAYMNSLAGNIVADPEYEILSIIGEKDEVAAFYTYKDNLIGQLFWCNEGKISRTLLAFDTTNII